MEGVFGVPAPLWTEKDSDPFARDIRHDHRHGNDHLQPGDDHFTPIFNDRQWLAGESA